VCKENWKSVAKKKKVRMEISRQMGNNENVKRKGERRRWMAVGRWMPSVWRYVNVREEEKKAEHTRG
jgi:hypothetical protein